jgi:hypothetical protein
MRIRSAWALLASGVLLLTAGLTACESAPMADPSTAAARRLIAEAHLYLPEAGPEFGQRPILLARLAQAHAETGDHPEAERLFSAAIADAEIGEDPEVPAMALLAGILYLQTQSGLDGAATLGAVSRHLAASRARSADAVADDLRTLAPAARRLSRLGASSAARALLDGAKEAPAEFPQGGATRIALACAIADAFADTGDLATARALVADADAEARRLATPGPKILLPLIRSLAHVGRDAEAAALAERLASPGAWAALALGRADRDDAEGALAAIDRAGAKPPFLPDLIGALAWRHHWEAAYRLARKGGAAFELLDPIAEEQARIGDVAGLNRTLSLYAVETDRPGYLLRRAHLVTGDLAALDADPGSAQTIERARLLARAGLREEALALAEGFKAEPSGITPFQLIELALELAHRPGAADVDLTALFVR